jgi:hypothetical protein
VGGARSGQMRRRVRGQGRRQFPADAVTGSSDPVAIV